MKNAIEINEVREGSPSIEATEFSGEFINRVKALPFMERATLENKIDSIFDNMRKDQIYMDRRDLSIITLSDNVTLFTISDIAVEIKFA